MIQDYRKKPITIQAVKWDGSNASTSEIQEFIDAESIKVIVAMAPCNDMIVIPTLEGPMMANVGDYIIRGVEGEFYPCKPSIFEKAYECLASAPAPAPACAHEYDRYLPGVTYTPPGTGPTDKLIPGGFSVCHKCRRVETVFPGDKAPTIFERGRLLDLEAE